MSEMSYGIRKHVACNYCDNKYHVKLSNIVSKCPILDLCRDPKLNTEHITKIYE